MSRRGISLTIIAIIAILAIGILLARHLGSGGGSADDGGTEATGPQPVSTVATLDSDALSDADSAAAAALWSSSTLFESSRYVIVSADDNWKSASYSAALGIPGLILGDDVTQEDLATEIERLGATDVLLDGIDAESFDTDAETHALSETGPQLLAAVNPEATFASEPSDESARLSALGTDVFDSQPTTTEVLDTDLVAHEAHSDVLILTDGSYAAAAGNARAAGAEAVLAPEDPRAMSDLGVLGENKPVITVMSETSPDFEWQLATARTGVELPGGGQLIFDGKRYIALYGSPVTSALGVLGEQDAPSTLARAEEYANKYAELTDDTVVPTLEIIVTVASGSAGDDGNYSGEWPIETFTELIESAGEAGQYVVLDFQPGRSDFLSQVKQYEELLAYPHVGVALDPEWRLGPDEFPLQRIGHVEIDEVNEVVNYVADYTRENNLPQKMIILHQFQVQMLRDIDQLDQSRSEVAILIHVDGQGSQGAKQQTWATLLDYASDVEYWGWKNFYDEDTPMLTPEQTYQVQPLPDFVSYQ